jgi:hypothetical protein
VIVRALDALVLCFELELVWSLGSVLNLSLPTEQRGLISFQVRDKAVFRPSHEAFVDLLKLVIQGLSPHGAVLVMLLVEKFAPIITQYFPHHVFPAKQPPKYLHGTQELVECPRLAKGSYYV